VSDFGIAGAVIGAFRRTSFASFGCQNANLGFVAFELRFSSSARRQLKRFNAARQVMIVNAIENQLSHEPLVETRNRKLLRPNPLAPWELRVGEIRVFYEVEQPQTVTILAIGVKRGSRLYIDGEEIAL
jgi:mRNA-degrading endonuclease RelE of RelBE toxin-antitoxin system